MKPESCCALALPKTTSEKYKPSWAPRRGNLSLVKQAWDEKQRAPPAGAWLSEAHSGCEKSSPCSVSGEQCGLEIQFQSKLNDARVASAADFRKQAASESRALEPVEVCVVQEVEHLGPELE